MLLSYTWLQKYFADPLPEVDILVDALTFGVAEIESVEKRGTDTRIDIKVLPDRACYLLSHRGVATEISVLLGIPMKADPLHDAVPSLTPEASTVGLVVDNATANPVHTLALIEGVSIQPSPEWLVRSLETVGQRSINTIVDATNYVLFDIGQPTHAFDFDKLSEKDGVRGIRVRPSVAGERITLLGGTPLELPEGVEMLCDMHTNAPLDIAGIKGGTHAEITEKTTRVLVTAATFNPTLIRKTAARLGIKTDAVKRFENGVPRELPLYGMHAVVAHILALAGGSLGGYKVVAPVRASEFKVGVSTTEVNRILGTTLSGADVTEVLQRFGWTCMEVDNPRESVCAQAQALVGTPYVLGASVTRDAPKTFDCSSFSAWLYAQVGVGIPRVSVDQYLSGVPIDAEEARPGDLIFSNTQVRHIWYESRDFLPGTKVPEGVDHVGVYLGNGMVAHCAGAGGDGLSDINQVVIETINTADRFKNIVGYRRMVVDEPRLVVTVPFYRTDVRTKEDLIEEIVRVYGYGKIQGVALPPYTGEIHRDTVRLEAERVRESLTAAGFSEVLTYTFRAQGATPLANPLARDKSFLRENLAEGVSEALEKAEYYLPLTGMKEVLLFEVGTVFGSDTERVHVCVGVRTAPGKKRDERNRTLLDEAEQLLTNALGLSSGAWVRTATTIECPLPGVAKSQEYPRGHTVLPSVTYTPPSPYPFVLRDIALWVEEGVSAEVVEMVIRAHAGVMVRRVDLFDTFKKDGRISYAFHLVFQSSERTLSDEEVTTWMESVYTACTERGWETR